MPKQATYPLLVGKKPFHATIYKTSSRGKDVYEVRYKVGTEIKRVRRNDPVRARALAEEVAYDKEHAANRLSVTEEQIFNWQYCEQLLREKGGGATLLQAVDSFILGTKEEAQLNHATVSEAVDSYLETKEQNSPRYYETLRWALDPLANNLRMPLALVRPAHIEAQLSQTKNRRTRKNIRSYYMGLFNWARKAGYLPYNEPHAVERTTDIVVKKEEPGILTPSEMERVLQKMEEVEPRLIAWTVLGAFGGLRSAERDRLRWEDLNWEEEAVPLSSAITKTSRRRVVDMPDNLKQWLLKYKKDEGRISPFAKVHPELKKIFELAEVGMPHNAIRHSFASYHLCKFKNAHLTAELSGHSVSTLQSDYKAITYSSEAEKWFNISPQNKE
jgi:integrase